MSNALDIAKVSARGGFNVLWGLVISSIVSSVGVIFIARLLGSDSYGLYTIAFAAPNLLSIFRDWGMNYAIVRFTAKYRAEGRLNEVRSVLLSGLIFEIAAGLVLCLISLTSSDYLAVNVFNRPILAPIMQIASFYILASGLIGTVSAAFTGLERMGLNSIVTVCQSVIKTVLIIVLVVFGLGTSGAVIGLTFAAFIAGAIGIILLLVTYRSLPKSPGLSLEIKEYLKEMLHYGLPLSFAVLIASFSAQYYAFLLPIHYVLDNSVIGNYGIAQNFIVLIGFFSTPITTMMFPAFSKLDYKKDQSTLKQVYQFSVKYASLLVVPVVGMVIALSYPAVSVLFGNSYESAPLFLALLAIGYTFTAIGNLSTSNLINSQGQTKFILKITILTACIGIPLGTVLVLTYGVIGLIITSLIEGTPSAIISLYWIRKHYGVTVDWPSSAKIIFSTALASTITFIALSLVSFNNWIELIMGVAIFVLIVGINLLLTKAVTLSDINNGRLMVNGLGILGKLVNKLLSVIEKLIITLRL